MDSVTLKSATKVYQKSVARIELAKYYLKTELPNILGDSGVVSEQIESAINNLPEPQTWRLLEALSYTYRMNGIFHLVSNQALDWYEVELPLEAITLTGTTPEVNKVVYSQEVNRNPARFARYLKRIHKGSKVMHPDLGDFMPKSNPMRYATLMTIEHKGKIAIVDGSHRLMALALKGETSVRAFAAVRNGKRPKQRVGDSTFLTLRGMYERYQTPEQREQVMNVAAWLARMSTDGRSAIKTYWIQHPRSRKLKAAGRALLKRI